MPDGTFDYLAVRASKVPMQGILPDGTAVTVIDAAVYRRLAGSGNPSEKDIYKAKALESIDIDAALSALQKLQIKKDISNLLQFRSKDLFAGAVPDADRNGRKDLKTWIFMDSDSIDPQKLITAASVANTLSISAYEKDIYKYYVFEHEKAHLRGFGNNHESDFTMAGEAGADEVAATTTLNKYGADAKRILHAAADFRLMESFIMSNNFNLPIDFNTILPPAAVEKLKHPMREVVSKYGYECSNAIEGAITRFENPVRMQNSMKDIFENAAALNQDYIARENSRYPIDEQPEMKVRQAIEADGHGDIWVRWGRTATLLDLQRLNERIQLLASEKPFGQSVEGNLLQRLAIVSQRVITGDYGPSPASPVEMPSLSAKPNGINVNFRP